MRTSADRPMKYSDTVLSPCPRCGKDSAIIRKSWCGLAKKEHSISWDSYDKYKRRGVGVKCENCGFGVSEMDHYYPNGNINETVAIIVWNMVADVYDVRKEENSAPKVDVNDLLEKAGIKS